MLYVLNIGESAQLGADLEAAAQRHKVSEVAARPGASATAVCGKVEAELAEMSDEEAAEFLSSYGLTESGLVRLIRNTYELLGMISFFTVGEDECRAWSIPRDTPAVLAAGEIHSDISRGFIRAEVVRYEHLLARGSLTACREHSELRLEGKEYIVLDGDVINFRHAT
jgi:ribosome-binding ATPase YchF (GTP1/OBG family)